MRNLLLFSLITACAGTTLVSAQTYPVRPIRVIVPGSPGSANDFTARAIGQRLTDAWGQQIVIDNRAGAGGILAHELAAKATPGELLAYMHKESERWDHVIKTAHLKIEH